MAILKTEQGDIEVRIKRHPDDTYYDEYIKVEDKDKDFDESCERYIIPEPGTTYSIETTLKNGFCFDKYGGIGAQLSFLGGKIVSRNCFWNTFRNSKIKTDISKTIQCVNVEVDGEKMIGARFALRALEVG